MRPVHHIAVVNKSGLDDADVCLWIEAYRAALPKFCEDWGLPIPGLALYDDEHEGEPIEEAAIFIVDSAGKDDAFGFHGAFGVARYGYLDVNMCRAWGEPPSRTFGHELFEMGADPDLDRWTTPIDGFSYAIEVCDAVQRFSRTVRASFMGHAGDVELAAYCLSSWYDPSSHAERFDDQGICKSPFEVAPGGYCIRERNTVVVTSGVAGVRVSNVGRTFRRMAKLAASRVK